MEIDVLECKIFPTKRRIGSLLVQYGELLMNCDLKYYVPGDRAWVKMPEVWLTPDKKVKFCFWPTKELSEEFQKKVLNKIFDKYDLSFEKIVELHDSVYKKVEKKQTIFK